MLLFFFRFFFRFGRLVDCGVGGQGVPTNDFAPMNCVLFL